MFKTLASSLLLAGALGYKDEQVGVPPHTHNCKTEGSSPISWGLAKDYDMGGCKCADDTAEWTPNAQESNAIEESWACYCQVPNTYASMPYVEHDGTTGKFTKVNDKNRLECGVILECQTTAVLQQKGIWNSKMSRLQKEYGVSKYLAEKQLVQEDEINKMQHVRVERTKHNRVRAKTSLSAVASKYAQVKMQFVNGAISK